MIRLEKLVKYFHHGSVNEVFALCDIDLQSRKGISSRSSVRTAPANQPC